MASEPQAIITFMGWGQIYIRSTVVHGFPHFGQLHWFPVPLPFLSLSPSLEDEMLLQLFSWL